MKNPFLVEVHENDDPPAISVKWPLSVPPLNDVALEP
jgi:hypothetical protein